MIQTELTLGTPIKLIAKTHELTQGFIPSVVSLWCKLL